MSEIALAEGNSRTESSSSEFWQRIDARLRLLEFLVLLWILCCHTIFYGILGKVVPAKDITFACLGILLSFLFPLWSTLKLRQEWRLPVFFLETTVIAVTSAFGVTRLFLVPYLLVSAKAAVSLTGRALVLMNVIILVEFLFAKELSFFLNQQSVFWLNASEHIWHVLVFGRAINFVIAIGIAIVAILVLKKEQHSRNRRDELNEKVKEYATIAERNRLSREIHDHVGHSLTALKMQIELARRAATKKSEKLREALETSIDLATKSRVELRRATGNTSAANTDFANSMIALQKVFNAQLGPRLELDMSYAPDDLPESALHHLISIATEAVNNAGKYSQAQSVKVVVQKRDGAVVVSISDDGKGFDPAQVKADSFGLKGMRERAEAMGASLTVDSKPEVGTQIIVVVKTVSHPGAAS